VTRDPEQLRAFAKRYSTAWCSMDPARVAGQYAPEGSLTINDGPPAVGRAAITEAARNSGSTRSNSDQTETDPEPQDVGLTRAPDNSSPHEGSRGGGGPKLISTGPYLDATIEQLPDDRPCQRSAP
jgi:hypothetical protein